jgi:glycosyltransferase involved in cell wall biosynthesis
MNTKEKREKMVSIITPTYNRAYLIERCIDSIAAQTYSDWELIIVDDGSTDNTPEIIQKYLEDTRIRYIQKKNTGGSDSRNFGVSLAKHDFIAFLDSDDEALPNWLEEASKKLTNNVGILSVGAIRQHADGRKELDFPYTMSGFGKDVKVKFTCGSLFIRRSVYTGVNGFDTSIPSGLMSEMGFRLLDYLQRNNLEAVHLDQCLVKVYFHEGERMRNDWNTLSNDVQRFVERYHTHLKRWDIRELASNYAVLAFYNYKAKKKKEALINLSKAIRYRPLYFPNYMRAVKYAFS